MNKADIIDFQSRLTEARNILESSNEREISKLEQAISDANEMVARLRVRHSELNEYITRVWEEWRAGVDQMMVEMIARELQLAEEYKRRLIELKETPPPKFIEIK